MFHVIAYAHVCLKLKKQRAEMRQFILKCQKKVNVDINWKSTVFMFTLKACFKKT